MIERYYGQYTPTCDYCDKRLPGQLSNRDALRAIQEAGWEVRREGEYLGCVCTDCLFEEKGYDNDEIPY